MPSSQGLGVFYLLLILSILSGCATVGQGLGFKKLEVPPEFNQKVILDVSDEFKMHQASRSTYDVGDLQAFHTQRTLPITIEEAFKEMFGQVDMKAKGLNIEASVPEVPAIFEVRIIDLANDVYIESAENYRTELTLAVAMKSPRGHIFWQQVFRGQGSVHVDPQFSTGLGPNDAVVDALRDAIDQMQKAIIASPEVRVQMKHYMASEQARREKEIKA